ncbi:MAG: DUF2235 domain-containing protein [Halieaceae bacterium]
MADDKRKRIVICADGTWNDPEDENSSNVLRMARAIRPVGGDGIRQVVFYDWGVGSYYAPVSGGVSGRGMIKNIQDGYRFIVQNYRRGDQIFLFGFSRGAYTVRCLAGMLNNCGVLKRELADSIPDAFGFYKNRRVRPGSVRAADWRQQKTGRRSRGVVDFIGVWDTVGALGMPTRVLAFAEERDLFFDVELGSNIKMARHAVAIDEQRADFQPTLWHPKDSVDMGQVWFAGVHADVGGGYAAAKGQRLLSDLPLAWMAKEAASAGLDFERHLYQKAELDPLAPAHKSHKRFWRALGRAKRSIPADATLHRSVRQRYESGDYRSSSLREWLKLRDGDWGTLAS